MPITQNMTPFPTPIPSRDDPANFATRADATLGHLQVFVPEANTMVGQINTEIATANTTLNSLLVSTQNSANNAAQSASAANNAKNEAIIAAATAGYKGTWLVGATYAQGDTVTYNSRLFISKVNGNVGNTPTEGANWALLGTGRLFIVGRYI